MTKLVVCPCGKTFDKKRNDFWSYIYCSEECYKKFESIKNAKNEEDRKKRETPSICVCGKEFFKYGRNTGRRVFRSKYCSNECRLRYSPTNKRYLAIRFDILQKNNFTCRYCGRKAPEVELQIKHKKPKSKYPNLALDPSNLSVACKECNIGKSDMDICLNYHFNNKKNE